MSSLPSYVCIGVVYAADYDDINEFSFDYDGSVINPEIYQGEWLG